MRAELESYTYTVLKGQLQLIRCMCGDSLTERERRRVVRGEGERREGVEGRRGREERRGREGRKGGRDKPAHVKKRRCRVRSQGHGNGGDVAV